MDHAQNGKRTARRRSLSRPKTLNRTGSLCGRCGHVRQRDESPAWLTTSKPRGRDSKPELSLERDGREARRRHASGSETNGTTSPMHCYIVPVPSAEKNSVSTTYREQFRSPPSQYMVTQHARIAASPVSGSPMWSPNSMSPRYTPRSATPTTPLQNDTHALLSKVPEKLRNINSSSTQHTTYRDHFGWTS